MPSLFSQFLPRVSSIAKMDLVGFAGLATVGARSAANCVGAGTRAEACGRTGGVPEVGIARVGRSDFAVLAIEEALGWPSRAARTGSCRVPTFSSTAGGMGMVGCAGRPTTAGPVGQRSLPPACTLPHELQIFASFSRGVGGVIPAGECVGAAGGVTAISIFLAAGTTGSGATGLLSTAGFSGGTVLSIAGDFSTKLAGVIFS